MTPGGARGGGGGRRTLWSEEEVAFLIEGVEAFGVGNWKTIRENYPFHQSRSHCNIITIFIHIIMEISILLRNYIIIIYPTIQYFSLGGEDKFIVT
jgi:hypothetical protein